jgi:hypothetical protein
MGDLGPRWDVRQTAGSRARAAEDGRERYAGSVRRPAGRPVGQNMTALSGLNGREAPRLASDWRPRAGTLAG